jgi:hypothetical protein
MTHPFAPGAIEHHRHPRRRALWLLARAGLLFAFAVTGLAYAAGWLVGTFAAG